MQFAFSIPPSTCARPVARACCFAPRVGRVHAALGGKRCAARAAKVRPARTQIDPAAIHARCARRIEGVGQRGDAGSETPHGEQFDAALDLTAKVAKIQIKNAVDTFWALNGRYPKDYAEFKREIIDANPTLRLPELPYYQEYGYDPETHELIILEYPDRKKKGR
jgi:hypothetical protein